MDAPDNPLDNAAPRRRDPLHVISTAASNTGGERSLLALIENLAPVREVELWCIGAEIHPALRPGLEAHARGIHLQPADDAELDGADVVFYMHDYALVFANFAELWRERLSRVGSLQIIINVNLGALFKFDWLAERATCVYFESSDYELAWRKWTHSNRLACVPTVVLPPPVDLRSFRALTKVPTGRVVVGRLSGHAPLPPHFATFYSELADQLPKAEFWFMPAGPELRAAFGAHPRFRLFAEDQVTPQWFLSRVDIFCFPLKDCWPANGPRSMVEAMAAGCPIVAIDREGPKDRVDHGASGFLTNDRHQMQDYVRTLVEDPALRARMGSHARQAARDWDPAVWAEAIVRHSMGTSTAPAL